MFERFVLEMEDKPYSVDSSDDINIEEEEERVVDNASKYHVVFEFFYLIIVSNFY